MDIEKVPHVGPMRVYTDGAMVFFLTENNIDFNVLRDDENFPFVECESMSRFHHLIDSLDKHDGINICVAKCADGSRALLLDSAGG